MDRPKLSTSIRSCQCVHNCIAFPMSVSYSLDHESFEVIKRHTMKGDHKGVSQVIRKYLLGCMYQDWDLSLP
jgi:hypothetical protein